ncbi:hypothetical protein [Actibacterium ureilyticum]|uniref:hypothetical protein n=1 Tax=Actibacterium ureilyticum TaxID=1590614 RepID=UPI001595F629|nr:hypothetical protein [Actibacterium ureilyticum]
MNTAPIDTWEGAEAYFTFAHSPGMISLILIASVVVTFGAIVLAAVHEKHAYNNH